MISMILPDYLKKSFDDEIPNLLQSTTRGITGLVTVGFSSCDDKTITISFLLNASTSSVRTTQFKINRFRKCF